MKHWKLLAICAIALTCGAPALATHVPVALDVPGLWSPDNYIDGYLEFINIREHGTTATGGLVGLPFPATPPGRIGTEEFTGYTLANGLDIIEIGDADVWAGDRADFDWVQENRPLEGGPHHAGITGAMSWTVGVTEASPHIDPGTQRPHMHVPPLPELENQDYPFEFFHAVDVFPIISEGQDQDPTRRDAALDYRIDFLNTVTGASTSAVPVKVWTRGWTGATGIDDYVARWVPAVPGLYNVVGIEPMSSFGHDEVTEIDAIKAIYYPEPTTLTLLAVGGVGLVLRRRRKR